MIQKIFHTLLLTGLAATLTCTPVLAEKSYYAERFDAQIKVQKDGTAVVTETVEFHFSGDPFTFAFREISAAETDGITFMDASMDGVSMRPGTGAGEVEVEGREPLKVTWHFAPTSDSSHVFTVRYHAAGVIRKGAADSLIWRVVPEDHDYRIKHSTITLTYPTGAAPLEPPALNRGFESSQEDGRVILTTSGLGEDEDLILTARFPSDSLTFSKPDWQAKQARRSETASRTLPVLLFSALAGLILGGLGFIFLTRSDNRDTNINPIVSTATPPGEVPPGLVGKLTGQPQNFMGTIFDLAQRGVVEIEERKGFLGIRQHYLKLNESPQNLLPHERGLIEALFQGSGGEIQLGDAGTWFEKTKNLFNDPIDQEMIQRGWVDPKRKQRQTQLRTAGLLVLLPGIMTLIASICGYSGSLTGDSPVAAVLAATTGLSAGAVILGCALLIYSSGYSPLTPAGEEQAARWKGFAEYLKQVTKGREPAVRADYFERYLPYAVIFGLGTRWAKYFQELGGLPLPVWFQAAAGSQGDFAALLAVISAGDSSAGAGAAGGGGASGGGSSGAG